MRKPLLLDLFCGAGLASDGYVRAGFDVVGVDLHRQPRYPYPFIQMDALNLDPRFLAMFDAIHASPPCQGLTEMNNDKSKWLNLIPQTREMLDATGKPYVIENVEGAKAHLIRPITLCGSHFDMGVCLGDPEEGTWFQLQRHRLFETNFYVEEPECRHCSPVIGIYGGHVRCRSGAYRTGKGTGRTMDFVGEDKPALAHLAMGVLERRVTMHEISEAIPPAYTAWIGGWLQYQMHSQRQQDEELKLMELAEQGVFPVGDSEVVH